MICAHLEKVKQYSTFSSDIDLIAEGGLGRPARRIRIVTAGSGAMTVGVAHGGDQALTALAAGEELNADFTKIESTGMTVSVIRVYW